jgi:tetratricopeptide (TPR) repeat protein
LLKVTVTAVGRADRPKNIIKTTGHSKKVIPFAQDAAYYASKGAYYNQKNKFSRALLFLQKAVEREPQEPWHHFNLACLLSRIDCPAEANAIFNHIVKELDSEMVDCYFYMAVNHGLLGEADEARHCLFKYLQESPDGELAEEAEDFLLAIEEDDDSEAYNRVPGITESEALLELIENLGSVQFKDRLLEDGDVAATLQWGLYQGSDLIREAIIRFYGESGCGAARKALREFAASPWVNERLRQVALLELKRNDPCGRCRVYSEGRFREISLSECRAPAPVWQSKWQQVLECTFANMRRSAYYGAEFFEDAEAIWLDFINRVYPAGPRVERLQTWAAGLEYCLARFHFLGLTQKELAAAYGVSTASVRRKFAEINRVLQIDRKAYRNMLCLLTERGDEI